MSEDNQQFLYLTTTGWKSGKPHEIEIWFIQHDGKYYLVSEHQQHSHWVKNIKKEPRILIRLGKTTYQGEGRLVDRRKEHELAAEVSNLMNKKYKWSDGLIVELVASD